MDLRGEGFRETSKVRGLPPISVVTITLNEERNIRSCLESVKWVDEIIIVDSFSTDKTVEICDEFTNRIYQRLWPGFGAQKNFGIDQALSEWVLIVDADEKVTQALREEIQETLKQPGNIVGYHIPRCNFWYGK